MDLTNWVKEKYEGRTIPISGEPYFDHCLTVARTAVNYTDFGYEVGLCHDMLEDAIVTQSEIQAALQSFSYSKSEKILGMVIELSDVYTPENYPQLSKKELRQLENKRLAHISAEAQTVKYADLLYNADWTKRYEPEKWPRYAKRKRKLLALLTKGNPVLREELFQVLSK